MLTKSPDWLQKWSHLKNKPARKPLIQILSFRLWVLPLFGGSSGETKAADLVIVSIGSSTGRSDRIVVAGRRILVASLVAENRLVFFEKTVVHSSLGDVFHDLPHVWISF